MKDIIKFNSLFFIPLFVFFFGIVQAYIPIWQLGKEDISGEFNSSEKRIIDYQVPSNWESLLDQDDHGWEEFPSVLYPSSEKENSPQEIRIQFSYLKDYNNPTLSIMAKSSCIDPNLIDPNLVIFKGGKELFIGEKKINIPTMDLYSFNLGYVRKGLHEKNVIIIKSSGPSDSYILFDVLYLDLDNKDSDGDGVSDADEGELYEDHNSLVRIPIKSYDPNPLVKKSITLHLGKTEETSPAFLEVKFLDPNFLNFPYLLCPNCYLPFDFLNFKVKGIEPGTSLLLQIGSTDTFSPFVRFYTFQDPNDWQEIAFDFMDDNSASMVLSDGGTGDSDGEINGHIHTILALLYPLSLGVQIEKEGCFIKSVFWRKNFASDF